MVNCGLSSDQSIAVQQQQHCDVWWRNGCYTFSTGTDNTGIKLTLFIKVYSCLKCTRLTMCSNPLAMNVLDL